MNRLNYVAHQHGRAALSSWSQKGIPTVTSTRSIRIYVEPNYAHVFVSA